MKSGGKARADVGIGQENAATGRTGGLVNVQPDGTFEFPKVLPGIYSASLTANVVGVAPVNIEVSDEPIKDFQIVIPRQRRLNGRVVLQNRGPRPRLFFSLMGFDGSSAAASPSPRKGFTRNPGHHACQIPGEGPGSSREPTKARY